MGDVRQVLVPDIGDFKDVPVIELQVKPGDWVEAEAPRPIDLPDGTESIHALACHSSDRSDALLHRALLLFAKR